MLNPRDEDMLTTKRELEQFSLLTERENARKIVQRHLRNENESYDEFLGRKEQENEFTEEN